MKKTLLILFCLFVICNLSNAQYFSASGGTGLALNLTSNSNNSVFGFNFVHAQGMYTISPLIATRLNFQLYDFPGKSVDTWYGTQSYDALLLIIIKGDFMIGNFERNASMQPYGYISPGIAIPTGGGGPFFHIDFGGGANFHIANNFYITAETGFGIVTSSPAGLYLPFRGGIKYDF